MNKSGNVIFFIWIIVVVMITAICILVAHMVTNNSAIQNLFETEEVTHITDNTKTTINNMDNIMMFVIFGLSLFVLLSATMVFQHPAMFIVSFIFLCIVVTVSAIMSNTFWTFSNEAIIATSAAAFPKMTYLMNHFPIYIGMMGILSSVAGYISYQK